ncbi:hypothetical protein F2Q70_00042774 [Brassica cretica]|uniref:Uncharacterized protein n=1 Tax=Brassica cretica TaxID=69181 RepID=A0A8S9KE83_BRACR|nr:hypothetical protein F2Q70_00042774 [Brassica cretica]
MRVAVVPKRLDQSSTDVLLSTIRAESLKSSLVFLLKYCVTRGFSRGIVDWESRLPCVLGPRKSRLSLFTRKQQRLLNKARDMEGVPDLSALLKGKLQLLSKKSTSVGPSESTSSEGARVDGDGGPRRVVPPTLPTRSASLDATSDGSKTKKKKKAGKKRPREGVALSDDREGVPVESIAGDAVEAAATEAEPTARPKKKTKKKPTEAGPHHSPVGTNPSIVAAEGDATPMASSGKRKSASTEACGSGSEPAGSERSAPDSSAKTGSRSGGSLVKNRRIEFPDRVEFSYNEKTPLILNPLRCAELTRQIRGGSRELPPLDDLFFKNEYIDAASARKRSDGSMNFLVEKYDSTLKQTMVQLGAAEKLAQARLKAVERSNRAARKELASEKTRLEQVAAALEKEKAELLQERDASVEKLIRERQRLKDSRCLEVTRERERVEAAMAEKAGRCFDRLRDHFARLEAFGKAKNLYGQASGTRKCLKMIKESGTEIPQEMIDVFKEQERFHEAEANKLRVGALPDSDLALSPLVLPSRFVEDRFTASFDPYGSNANLIRPEIASQLITSREVAEDPSDEPLVDVSSAPTEHVEGSEKDASEKRPEKEKLDEIPEKDAPETDDTLVQGKVTENAGTEDPVLISGSSSEGQDGEEEEEDDRAVETSLSLPPPNEIEALEEAEKESAPTQVDDLVAPIDPPASRGESDQGAAVDPPASRSEGDQHSAA